MSNRSPLATAGEPATTQTPTGERAQCRDRTMRGDASRTARRETEEDDVPRHVCCENVAKTQKADRINKAGDDRQTDERSNKRSLIIQDAGSRVHEMSSHLLVRITRAIHKRTIIIFTFSFPRLELVRGDRSHVPAAWERL